MSFKLVAKVFDIRVGNPLRKMVLIKLADQANDNGYCWPSYESLAYACEISRSSVINHIKWLAENDFLWIEKRYDKEAQKSLSNIYHLTLSKGKQVNDDVGGAAATPVQEMNHEGVVQEIHHPSAGDTPEVVQEIHHPSVGDTPKPITEPTIKPIKESIKGKKKKLTDYPDDFKPTEKQVDKMNEYGINIPLFLETFESGAKAKGLQYKCWSSAFTTWINNEIKFNKLVPVPAQAEYEPAFNGWNDRNPDYQPHSQQADVYHPSQAEFQSTEPSTYVPAMDDPNWRWTEPLPGMSIIETDRYIKENKRRGENPNRAYQRLLAEMQGAQA